MDLCHHLAKSITIFFLFSCFSSAKRCDRPIAPLYRWKTRKRKKFVMDLCPSHLYQWKEKRKKSCDGPVPSLSEVPIANFDLWCSVCVCVCVCVRIGCIHKYIRFVTNIYKVCYNLYLCINIYKVCHKYINIFFIDNIGLSQSWVGWLVG